MHMVDALAITGDERRDSLRKAAGSWQMSIDPQVSEWGNPIRKDYPVKGGERGELKHLSSYRKRNQPRFRE